LNKKAHEKDFEVWRAQDNLFELEKKFNFAQEQWRIAQEKFNAEMKQQASRWALFIIV